MGSCRPLWSEARASAEADLRCRCRLACCRDGAEAGGVGGGEQEPASRARAGPGQGPGASELGSQEWRVLRACVLGHGACMASSTRHQPPGPHQQNPGPPLELACLCMNASPEVSLECAIPGALRVPDGVATRLEMAPGEEHPLEARLRETLPGQGSAAPGNAGPLPRLRGVSCTLCLQGRASASASASVLSFRSSALPPPDSCCFLPCLL